MLSMNSKIFKPYILNYSSNWSSSKGGAYKSIDFDSTSFQFIIIQISLWIFNLFLFSVVWW